MSQSLQQRYAPGNICFGCGPANPDGLQIASFIEDGVGVCEFRPEPRHRAYAGAVNGGIIGTLFDCHCNWTATWHLMQANGLDHPPCTVTAEYSVRFLRPTPSDRTLRILARAVEVGERKARIEGTIEVDGVVTATCTALFVAVQEGHPAYHRW